MLLIWPSPFHYPKQHRARHVGALSDPPRSSADALLRMSQCVSLDPRVFGLQFVPTPVLMVTLSPRRPSSWWLCVFVGSSCNAHAGARWVPSGYTGEKSVELVGNSVAEIFQWFFEVSNLSSEISNVRSETARGAHSWSDQSDMLINGEGSVILSTTGTSSRFQSFLLSHDRRFKRRTPSPTPRDQHRRPDYLGHEDLHALPQQSMLQRRSIA